MRRRLKVTPGVPVSFESNGLTVANVNDGLSWTTAVFEGEFEFEVEDLDNYVQVKTGRYSRLTYRDPSGNLAVGDLVNVPIGWHNAPSVGEVIGLGRGGYDGYTKDVTSRLVSEAL